jgi:hypothetical protein
LQADKTGACEGLECSEQRHWTKGNGGLMLFAETPVAPSYGSSCSISYQVVSHFLCFNWVAPKLVVIFSSQSRISLFLTFPAPRGNLSLLHDTAERSSYLHDLRQDWPKALSGLSPPLHSPLTPGVCGPTFVDFGDSACARARAAAEAFMGCSGCWHHAMMYPTAAGPHYYRCRDPNLFIDASPRPSTLVAHSRSEPIT